MFKSIILAVAIVCTLESHASLKETKSSQLTKYIFRNLNNFIHNQKLSEKELLKNNNKNNQVKQAASKQDDENRRVAAAGTGKILLRRSECDFTRYEGHILYGHNDKMHVEVSLDECKDLCQYEIEWECKALDYNPQDGSCYLSKQSHLDDPDSFGEHWSMDYYMKVCSEDFESCPDGYFRCADNGVCIDTSLVCDGEEHCYEGSDEADCEDDSHHENEEYDCGAYYRCPGDFQNLICIPQDYKCDHYDDCPGGEDEADCEYRKCIPKKEFQCVENKKCIPLVWHCDRYGDCPDSSDEQNCSNNNY